MENKRTRVEPSLDAAAAPVSLITEVYDCLMHASRKQLAHLLSVFVKASSASVLEQVRDEAVKNGALQVTTSRYQRCSHSILDSIFSCLDVRDLRVAEAVCKRWRFACVDSGAGWMRALSSGYLWMDWLTDLARLRIKPEQLRAVQTAELHDSDSKQFETRPIRCPPSFSHVALA